MEPSAVAVATITWARTRQEEALLRRSVARLAAEGMPVAVADTGLNPAFRSFLESVPGCSVAVPSERGLVPQVHASLQLARSSGRRFILYVEPDKEIFFAQQLGDFVRRAPAGPDVGIVMASRSDESFQTYPPTQRYTEGVINKLCGDLVGCAGDYSYGPFLMTRELLPHVADLDARLGWGWRHFTFAMAHRLVLRVLHVTDDYICPVEQRAEDEAERQHRLRQLSQNLLGLLD
jgi:hypothetical protein